MRTGRFSFLTCRLGWILAAATVAAGCETAGIAAPNDGFRAVRESPPGLDVRVEQAMGAGTPRARVGEARHLSQEQADRLLSRLPPLDPVSMETKDIALRPSSSPPPRAGTVVQTPFPPPAPTQEKPPPPTEAEPLRVLRWMPEGEVLHAREVTVVFSRPMIPLTSLQDAPTPPIRLTPQPAGTWQWTDTRTARFRPQLRFPRATTYAVEIPAGTRSLDGGVLEESRSFAFTTPPLRVDSTYPSGRKNVRTDVPILVLFDQAVDQARLLRSVHVRSGSAEIPVRLLRPDELKRAEASDTDLAEFMKKVRGAGHAARLLALRTEQPLPKDALVAVEIAVGAPSAEGPGLTTKSSTTTFHTFPPLKIESAGCTWACAMGENFVIGFNNPIDGERFTEPMVEVFPRIPNLRIVRAGTTLTLSGDAEAGTLYDVRISSRVPDIYGQNLGAYEVRRWHVTETEETEVFRGPYGMMVHEAVDAPFVSITTRGHERLRVKVHRVDPSHYRAFESLASERWRWRATDSKTRHEPTPPGQSVFDGVVPVQGPRGQLTTTRVDLSAAMPDGLGHAVVTAVPDSDADVYEVVTWIQSTRLAIDAFADASSIVAFVTDLATGEPAGDIEVRVEPDGVAGRTDATGVAVLPLPQASAGHQLIIARNGADVAMLPRDRWDYMQPLPQRSLLWYVVDDRKTYRPGEEVVIKGWIRTRGPDKHDDLELAADVESVRYHVYDAMRGHIGEGTAAVNGSGGFDARIVLPDTPNLGEATIELNAAGNDFKGGAQARKVHSFLIREFRRPEYEVAVSASAETPILGDDLTLTAAAQYYTGGALSGAPVQWDVTTERTRFVPPGRDDYEFGATVRGYGHGYGSSGKLDRRISSTTSASGSHSVDIELRSVRPAVPVSIRAEAGVMDRNSQRWTGRKSLLIHPSAAYVGVRSEQYWYSPGDVARVEVIGVDHEGRTVSGLPIEVTVSRVEIPYQDGEYRRRPSATQTCSVTSAEASQQCSFRIDAAGSYEVSAIILDADGRASESETSFYAYGKNAEASGRVEQEKLTLAADRKEYGPGQTALVRVNAPFYPAEAIVTVRRRGILESRRIRLEEPVTVPVPITDAMLPNVFVQVDAVGRVARESDGGRPNANLTHRPAFATGSVELKVAATTRTLSVNVAPAASSVAPGAETAVTVGVFDHAGAPVAGAEVALFVVDEAVLALSGYEMPDPLGVMYERTSQETLDYYMRNYLILREDGQGGAYGEREEPFPSPPPPVTMRADFRPLAAFVPSLSTGADGKAAATFRLPDNLTRYRVIALAVSGARHFGKGESAITARIPLMVRPSPPRFLNFGDTFELPVLVQNHSDAVANVRVAMRAQNMSLTAGAGREIAVPPNDRVEVVFPAAAELPGKASFQVVAETDTASDAASITLPVWTPATSESFAVYGVIDEGGVRQPVAVPQNAFTSFGGLDVTTASTNLQSLTDSLLYLVEYPFECSEQIASRLLSIVALRDVLAAFQVQGRLDDQAAREKIALAVDEVLERQNGDGGFRFWDSAHDSIPFLSVHVTHALVRARMRGVTVPDAKLQQAIAYLRDIEKKAAIFDFVAARSITHAYALYVRKLYGEVDVEQVRRLIEKHGGVDKLPLEADGWLLAAVASEDIAEKQTILRYLLNRVSETAGLAGFVSDYVDEAQLLLAGGKRVDAVILDALIEAAADLDLIPKLVTGLLAHRTAGRWRNTQENVFSLLALDRYFRTFEKIEPDFVVRLWLGEDQAGDRAFRGRSTESHLVHIPMEEVAVRDGKDLVIAKDGPGRLYYRAGMQYAPAELATGPADRGFVVERSYEGVDDPTDVAPQADGSWKIRLGSLVRVRLRLFNEARRYQVALVDPLPAGLEAVAPVAASRTISSYADPEDDACFRWWNSQWYDHENMRDERVEAFSTSLLSGDHVYEYYARATTAGRFLAPPAKAEQMYMPETFSRSGSARVVVDTVRLER